jgi:hypothetical protein
MLVTKVGLVWYVACLFRNGDQGWVFAVPVQVAYRDWLRQYSQQPWARASTSRRTSPAMRASGIAGWWNTQPRHQLGQR